MKNLVKASFYSLVWSLSLWISYVSAITVDDTKDTSTGDNLTDWGFINTLDLMLWYVVWLLYFIAVLFGLWWAFQILTAWWDEDKVKKWKTTLINAVIGLIVIFLVSQIIRWIINIMNSGWDAVTYLTNWYV